jgi:hypothetical protein
VTDGRGLIAGRAMSLTEILLFVMGAIIFAAALSLAIGIASRLISVAEVASARAIIADTANGGLFPIAF